MQSLMLRVGGQGCRTTPPRTRTDIEASSIASDQDGFDTAYNASRDLVNDYRDGSGESNIRLLTGTIKADWIQLPVEQYLAALPTLKQGVIAGVFRQKGAGPWGITNAEKLQI